MAISKNEMIDDVLKQTEREYDAAKRKLEEVQVEYLLAHGWTCDGHLWGNMDEDNMYIREAALKLEKDRVK